MNTEFRNTDLCCIVTTTYNLILSSIIKLTYLAEANFMLLNLVIFVRVYYYYFPELSRLFQLPSFSYLTISVKYF